MGATDSKLAFRKSVFRLYEDKVFIKQDIETKEKSDK